MDRKSDRKTPEGTYRIANPPVGLIEPQLRRIAGIAGLQRLFQAVQPTLTPFFQPRHGHGGVAAERIKRFATQRAQDDFGFALRSPALRGLEPGGLGGALRFNQFRHRIYWLSGLLSRVQGNWWRYKHGNEQVRLGVQSCRGPGAWLFHFTVFAGFDRVYALMLEPALFAPASRSLAGFWPVKAEHLGKRQTWIRHYEMTAANYASCRFVESLGCRNRPPQSRTGS